MPGWLTNGVTLLTPATYPGGATPQLSIDTNLSGGQSPETAAIPAAALGLGPAQANVTATGTTQLGAKALTAFVNNVVQASTASTKGVRLPAAATGLTITVMNGGAAFGVKVYPSTNGKIGSASTNSAWSTVLAVGKFQTYRAINKTLWTVSF